MKRKIVKVDIEDAHLYDVDENFGLNDEQIENRFYESLTNKPFKKKGNSIFRIVVRNLATIFNLIYAIIAVYIIINKSWSNLTFLAVIVPNILIGIYQEIKAKLTIDKLSVVNAPKANVIRNGEHITIDTQDVVLDDILEYKVGDQVYTDCIIVSGAVEANEALLSGEADATPKAEGAELLAGSFIASGSCVAKAIRVGSYNYIEKLSGEVKNHSKPKSELLNTLQLIIRIVGCLIPVMFFVTYFAGWDKLSICSVVLAMIPAGLFLLTSIALFVGEINLAKKNTLVQELYCIEMLARVNCLCLDKTGTITDGTMRVVDCIEYKNDTPYSLREIVGSMLNAFEETNATSEALGRYFNMSNTLTSIGTIPFSSKRKYSAVTFKDPLKARSPLGTYILGAPEFVLKKNLSKIKAKQEAFAKEGYRVLALGFVKGTIDPQVALPDNVNAVALIALQDHIRDDAEETISYFNNNGVEIRVISGDDPVTVAEIARRAGIKHHELYISLEGMSEEEVADVANDYYIFGRVSPEQKQIIIRNLQSHGKICAMTGDGVNDILALKEADCSIAMASGAEAARYASHLVLLDSNFASMPSVVDEGRRVINNIQRTSSLFLVKTLFGIMLTLFYILLQILTDTFYEYPFKEPSTLMLIETITIGIPATLLALEPSHERVEGKFLINVLKTILPAVITIIIYNIALYFIAPAFNIPVEIYSSMAVILTNIICIFILYRVCKPFNVWKRLMFAACCIICALGYFISMRGGFMFNFIHCVSFDSEKHEFILLLIVLALSSYFVYTIFRNIFNRKKN